MSTNPNGKRVRTITEEVIPGTVEGSDREPIEPSIQDIDPTVADFLETYGGRDSYVTVHRIAKNGDKEFCGKYETSVFSEEFVKTEHGGGRYEVWLYADLEGSGIRRRGKHSFIIAEPKKDMHPVVQQQDNMMQFVVQQMNNTQMLLLEAIKSMGTASKSGSSLGELAGAMQLLRENSPAATASNPLEIMKTVLDISEKISKRSGSGAAEDNVYTLVKELAVPILERFAPQGPSQPQPPLDTETLNRPVSMFQIPAKTDTVFEEPAKENPPVTKTDGDILRELVAELKVMAKVNHDVNDIIKQVMDADEGENHAYDLLVHGIETYPFAALSMMDADIANDPNLGTWFEKLYNGIRAALRDTDTGGAAGDVPNADDHGKPGA